MYLFMYLLNIKKDTLQNVRCQNRSSTNDSKLTRPKGIEPLSQEPESRVISTTLRAQRKIYFTLFLKKIQVFL